MITKENQIKFYTEELKEIEFSVKKTFNSLALSLFQNGEILVGQYKGFDQKRANVFVDIPIGHGYHSPRLDQKFTCFTLAPGLERPTKWTDISYVEILKDRNRSDTKVIDFTASKREGWITMLIREIDSEFVDSLQYNQILGFGPVIPPYEYIENLLAFSKGISVDQSNIWNDILSFKYRSNKDNYPILLTEEIDIAKLIIEKVDESKVFILQGPPGTGKTHQIADLASRLVSKGNSVLLTALTNKAALEVCTKSFFDKLFDLEKIFKLPLLLDEKRRFPKLLATDNLLPVKGHLNLTTYYQFSKIWTTQTQTYDYVIVEEASQAFLTTIAAACKVGKKVIIIGDPKQIVPIVSNKDFNKIPNVSWLINGMQTVSNIDDFSYYRKVETRRLTKRACMFTNSFYENTMVAKSLIDNLEQEIEELHFLKQYIPNQGGPVLVRFKNVNILEQMIEFLVKGINELSGSGKNEIAVLTPYVDTLKILQQNLKQRTVAKNFLIESVDRVQGLDVDYCFYVVAKSSSFSFDTNRFNVATSRAKKVTFILVEENFDKLLVFSNEVVDFWKNLKNKATSRNSLLVVFFPNKKAMFSYFYFIT